MLRSLTEIKREGVECLAALQSDSAGASSEAGLKLVSQAKAYGLNMRDYLTLKINPRLSAKPELYVHDGKSLNGYEAALSFLNLPVRDDFQNGVVLQAASETFQTFPGTRAMFPPVIDDMLKWAYRQDQIEQIAPMISNSRTIDGVEMVSTVVNDSQAKDQGTQTITEGARIPVRSIVTSEVAVKIWKHGSGLRTTYEFERRARLDILTPYAARIKRELEKSKVTAATSMLVNGDSVQAAAPVVTQISFNAAATAGKIDYLGLLAWLVSRAQLGTPVDTVVGNWDAYLQWLMLFSVPRADAGTAASEGLAKAGFLVGGVPLLKGSVDFALSSSAPAGKLIGYSRGDTMEELIEAGSQINESERSIINQTITYLQTENTGYRLAYGDTRSIYNYAV